MDCVSSSSVDPLEPAVAALLAATEALALAIRRGESSDSILVAHAARDERFAALVRASEGGPDAPRAATASMRAWLARIAALDAEILAEGAEELARLTAERLGLSRRRQAVEAHGVQERVAPRAVTVRA